MAGAWLLDKLAAQRGIELTLFICTSSISSVWGSVGQNAYSAANAFLDALAEHRRTHGRPATTINYGPWARVGMGAANEEGLAWLRSRGIRPLDPALALDGMEAAVATEAAGTVFADVNWTIFRELAELQRQRPLFEKLGRPQGAEAAESSALQPSTLVAQLTAAAPADRAELLMHAAREELAKVLQRPAAELGDEVGFFDLGMDSLMAVEFRNALSQRLSRKLPATVVMDRPDIASLTTYIIEDTLGLSLGKTRRPGALDNPVADDTEAEVAAMSSGEVDSALDDELKAVLRE
jgi:acyl carrier protein